MSLFLRIVLIIGSVGTCYFVLRRIQKNQFIIEDALFWIVFSLVLVTMGFFPGIMTWMADIVGVESPANLVYLLIIFALLIKLFIITLKVSRLESKINRMVQEYAIEHKCQQNGEVSKNRSSLEEKSLL